MPCGGEVWMLGIDLGSVALKTAVTDRLGNLLEHSYQRTHGKPIETTIAVLSRLLDRWGAERLDLVAGTGSACPRVCSHLEIPFVNEVIGHAAAIRHLRPDVQTLVEMGGQDSKLIFLSASGGDDSPMHDFAMTSNCAAGTGSFLDQQAARLGIRIEEEFGRLALASESPSSVAGRCSVFAKSDMIHLQQQGSSVEDILAGLCLGLARNLKSNLARGMRAQPPMAFCGGVAANAGVVRAIEHVFQLEPGQLIVPDAHAATGALGAILVAEKERSRRGEASGRRPGGLDLSRLRRADESPWDSDGPLAPLGEPSNGAPQGSIPDRCELARRAKHEPIEAYLGLDVGSISTKVAVIDAGGNVLAKVYLMTAGRPLDAVRRALKAVGEQVGDLAEIRGAASTGSGRHLTGDFIGADLVVNEITAQATAALLIDPAVDSIFEIGGQDSKYIRLEHGAVVDFEMNHACAAGTGSFLEEQAECLGLEIDRQFAAYAFQSRAPVRLGDRCTVFMASDLVGHQHRGAPMEDLVAGLCYSVVSNYLNRVVGRRTIGKRIFFQGGTAYNRGVLAAFEQVTGRKITVAPHHEVTGAIGAAVLAKQHQERRGRPPSRFGGFQLADVSYELRSFACNGCSNGCEINQVQVPGRSPLLYGSRCDRYNRSANGCGASPLPDLVAERHQLLVRHGNLETPQAGTQPAIGIPLALSSYELLPLWGTLLQDLGFPVVLSPRSTRPIIRRGVETVVSTPCFPVKVAHGHVFHLIDQGVDFLWLPSVVNMPRDGLDQGPSQLCPYIPALPYQVTAAAEQAGRRAPMLRPLVRLDEGPRGLCRSLQPLVRRFGLSAARLRQAVRHAWKAQQDFRKACQERGRAVLGALAPTDRAVVLVSRPYNGCDPGAYLNLPGKLRGLGILPIPLDFLDLDSDSKAPDELLRGMYWQCGQRIFRAADVIRQDPRLYAIYLSNFSCGPDSFLVNYFRRRMSPKPTLVLEIDEHSADAGVVTRLEAFLETLQAGARSLPPRARRPAPRRVLRETRRTIHIPWMGDQSYGMAAAFRACGQPAAVIPLADQESLQVGLRHASGKECLPCIITAGDMIRTVQQPGADADSMAFLMPGGCGPCRFGQYGRLHQLLLDDLGLGHVPVVSPAHDEKLYDDWSRFRGDLVRLGWIALSVFDVLLKAQLAIRPYERELGRTDAVYQAWCERACRLIEARPTWRGLAAEMAKAAAEFAAIPVERRQGRPRIGVVGEIYIRHHAMANQHLVRQLERLGAEAILASFPEWHHYTNWIRKTDAWRAGKVRQWVVNALKDRIQRRWHRRVAEPFAGLVDFLHEPPTESLLDLASPYLDPLLKGGDAVLSVGRMIEMHHAGCHGVINVMPFTCMPSTIVDSLMNRVAGAVGRMPLMSVSYDGSTDPALPTRLEAFVHQARAYQGSR